MKRLFLLLLILALTGCGSEKSAYDKVHDKLMNMECYSADVKIKYISNNNENSYTAKQYCKMTGQYRIETSEPEEVKGNVILFDSKMIWQYNPKIENKFKIVPNEKQERRLVLLSSFVENYVKSKDTTVETASAEGEDTTVLEAKVPGGTKYFHTEKLTCSNETLMPVRLVVYDEEGKERIIVEFTNFEYNPKLDDSMFSVEQMKKE